MKRAVRRYVLLVGAVVVLTFVLPRALPGDPIEALGDNGSDVGQLLPVEDRQALRIYYGLDAPLPAQFWRYVSRLGRLDFGWSYSMHRPVRALIAERLPYTVGLVGTSVLVSAVLGTLLGTISAWRAGGALDRGVTAGLLGLAALPEFLVGLVLLAVFAVAWPVLPAAGAATPFLSLTAPGPAALLWDRARHFVLPASVLALSSVPQFYYLMRNATVHVLDAPYLTVARAKGLTETRVALRHAARATLLPVASLFGVRVAFIAGGAVIVEQLFGYPGIGQLMVQAVWARDYPVLEGCFLLFSLSVLTVNLAVDALLARIDPRVRETT